MVQIFRIIRKLLLYKPRLIKYNSQLSDCDCVCDCACSDEA